MIKLLITSHYFISMANIKPVLSDLHYQFS